MEGVGVTDCVSAARGQVQPADIHRDQTDHQRLFNITKVKYIDDILRSLTIFILERNECKCLNSLSKVEVQP